MTPSAAVKRDVFFAGLAARAQLMGIVNVTPDSFSDGGCHSEPAAAIAQAHRHIVGGADIIDVGAESTRPRYTPVSQDEEVARLKPVLASLIAAIEVAVSVDTTKPAVAALAIEAGAAVINDQWALQRDPAMAEIVAAGDAGLVLMHNRDGFDAEVDILDDMRRFFDVSLARADRVGISRDRLILDPGIGFGKTKAQNVRALGAGVTSLRATYDLPVLVGASRKSLFAALIGASAVEARLVGTIAAHLAAFTCGARVFRVHDCAEHRDALAVTQAIAGG